MQRNRTAAVLLDLPGTQALAERLGPLLRAGDVVALHGTLGAGKTAFARALIQGLQAPLGILEDVPSPTFTLVQYYAFDKFILWHFDLYRIDQAADAYELGIEEAFHDGVSVIEWPERLGPLLPDARLDIFFETPDADAADTHRLVRLEWSDDWAERMAHV